MNRVHFDRELHTLRDDVMVMGGMVDRAIDRSIAALRQQDLIEARKIIADDAAINRRRFDIEEHVMQIIARQQPMAGDLRIVLAALTVVQELERMGDHAAGIAKIVVMHGDEPLLKPLIDVPRMADKARDMLERSLQAFISEDVEASKKIAQEDDEVDALYNQVYRELITFMLADPRSITRATYLLWTAHNLERIADRVTNICERTVFAVTGRFQEFNVSSY
ncbi:MAG: phosphate signaling complex protein PhoU [Chloroflexi bacterium]|nr:phosphate signaling complex protein PhoU [Chloroflexota bacterium]MCL5107954.1 phosphate signaling complex protein PhoU [Chloroflexota bacterium]